MSNTERKSFGYTEEHEEGSPVKIIRESFEGFIPPDEVPSYARAYRYRCPYTGEPRTYIVYSCVAPAKIVEVKE